jgi:transcriptional regulator with XRE-family HTH domain
MMEMAAFLKSRRARLSPEDVGLHRYGHRRRVEGLRREELAQLAGIGVDYYVRLERGRAPGVSADVLNALAEALRLSDVEREYLGNLGAPTWPRPTLGTRTVRPAMQALVDSITNVPAYVIGPLCDVLAWNRLACAVFTDFSAIPAPRRTWSHLLYLHEDIQRLFHDWEAAGAENVAVIRMQTSRFPTDPELNALVDGMLAESDAFRTAWARHEVGVKSHARYLLHHPVAGDLPLLFQALDLPNEPGQLLVTYTAEPDSAPARALVELAALAEDMAFAGDA